MSSQRSLSDQILLVSLVLAVGAAAMSQVAASAAHDDLAAVRAATARYHQVEVAIADGYVLGYNGIITGCIAHPTDGCRHPKPGSSLGRQ